MARRSLGRRLLASDWLCIFLNLSILQIATTSPTKGGTKHYWPGWEGITHMIVFGDSYTTTGFNDTLAQPSKTNPLGNPDYPGYTATNGPNWVDFLTTTYNATFLETLNLAYGGATVDQDLVPQYLPTVLSLKDQINKEYIPKYSDRSTSPFHWKPRNTLFAAFLGINDVGNAYANANASEVLAEDMVKYANLMDKVYHTGARNFLFLNVPPVNRSPLTKAQGHSAMRRERKYITAWNANVSNLATKLSNKYSDATTFVFDTNALFKQVLDNPCSHKLTCPYKNTTDYCFNYENGTSSWYTFDKECGIPVDQYFWLNTLHPTFRVMNATAKAIAKMLS